VEALEGRAVPSTFLFDFGTPTSPFASGYARVSEQTSYSPARGYGFDQARSRGLASRDRGGPDALLRDLVLARDAIFLADLPNGTYDVTTIMAERAPGDVKQGMAVYLEGRRAATLAVRPGEVVRRAFPVTVRDGQLTLRLRDVTGPNPHVVISALEVRPQASLLSFEAEHGTGQGIIHWRERAFNHQAVWFHASDARSRTFDVPSTRTYRPRIRWSNDGDPDTIHVLLDGRLIGSLVTHNTRVSGAPSGSGWDEWVTSVLPGVVIGAGRHTLTIRVAASDTYGVEIDQVQLS
jgi:hypothetical protein